MTTLESTFHARWARRVAIALGLIALVLLIHAAREVLLLFFAGLLLGIFLGTLGDLLRSRVSRLSRGAALSIVVLLLFSLAVSLMIFVGPRIAEQGRQLSDEVPRAVDSALNSLSGLPGGEWLRGEMQSFESPRTRSGTGLLSRATGVFSTVFGVMTEMVVVIVVGLYLAVDPQLYRRGALHLVPKARREETEELFRDLGNTLRWWLVGRFSSMGIILIFNYLALLLLDIPAPFALAIFAGILTFVPNFGPIVAAVPAVLMGFVESPQKGFLVLGAYLVIQVIESYLVTPLIQQRAVSLPPALILLSQVLFGVLFGFWGLVLATPMTATLLVVVQRLYVRNVLGDTTWDTEDIDFPVDSSTAS